ncbi:MAG: TRAP transporter small permease [Pigmentiphaga sp.]|nr:TRAP transporter small permease [Pigmentiphaga sp.]
MTPSLSASPPSSAGPGARAWRTLMLACGAVAGAMFVAITVLVCADVFFRNLGFGSIQWGLEVTEYLLMTATFLGAPYLLYLGEHIRVDIIVQSVSSAARRVLDIVSDVFGFAVCALLFWESMNVLLDTQAQGGMVFKVLIFPEWWLTVPMTFSVALLALEFLRRLRIALTPRGG